VNRKKEEGSSEKRELAGMEKKKRKGDIRTDRTEDQTGRKRRNQTEGREELREGVRKNGRERG
jgi:hypothetical protein